MGTAAISRARDKEQQGRAWRHPATLIAGLAAAFYFAFGIYCVLRGQTWTDEVTYVAKAWWYVNGLVAPYSEQDATWYMPLYFYQLGLTQKIFGAGMLTARLASLVIGGAGAALLFVVCRRLTGNVTVSAMAVLLYVATPATTYYFATATPVATVALLHLGVVWAIVEGRGRPRAGLTIAAALMIVALLFYRNNMIIALAVLAPAYIWLLGRARLSHTALLLGVIVAGTAAVLLVFPPKLAIYAVRLPVVSEVLNALGLLPGNWPAILGAAQTPLLLEFDSSRLALSDIIDAFMLPYLGTVLLALLAFDTRAGDPAWKFVPAYFFFVVALHYLGSVGYCPTCILTYTNFFVSAGVIAAALGLSLVWQRRMKEHRPPLRATAEFLIVGMLLNGFASAAAYSSDPNVKALTTLYPAAPLRQPLPTTELDDMESFARVIAEHTPADKQVLVINTLPSLTYAVFRAGRVMPPQSLNPRESYRQTRADLRPGQRAMLIKMLEGESLWTDETLQRWLASDFDVVVYQRFPGSQSSVLEATLDDAFTLAADADFRGSAIRFYVRKASAPAPIPAPETRVRARRMVCEWPTVRAGFGAGC